MDGRRRSGWTWPLALTLLFSAGCGLDLPLDEDSGTGPVCYVSEDCVANACCGNGTGAVHVSQGPNCSSVSCTGTCPRDSINCGQCVPYCRDSHCVSAC